MGLSNRGRAMLSEGSPLVEAHFAVAADPWSPENPDGYINLGTAENHLLFDLLEPRLTAARPVLEGDTHYQQLYGAASFRAELARFLGQLQGDEVDPEDLVVVGGTSVVLEILAHALCDPGEAIIVPTPYYAGLDDDFGGRAGVRVFPAPLDGFTLTADAIARAIASARSAGLTVRAVCLLSPDNPMGQVYDETTLRAVAEVVMAEGLQLIVDEIYAGSSYGAPFVSAATLVPDVVPPERLHLGWGFAKDFGLSGFKVGVLRTRDPEVRAVARQLAMFGPVSSDTQVFLRDLLADEEWTATLLRENVARLAAAYENVVKVLGEHGIDVLPAAAGLFVWIDLRPWLAEPTFEAELALWRRLFDEAKVNISPGAVFHSSEPGWFRLCFATSADTVRTAVERLGQTLSQA
ncbi:aminotransferase class I/II-fold pyridoxal phosphate-dependent enzyme [Kribbella deserti]|uniref:Aminotransferase class I/II-fold pyridoxal phosphate-dependent enzyme n=1 Tax=Kribbella deserti TaxID=1926257 RepID=A0ABV6QZW5_9ACTN